jgi:hypothetical protein
MEVMDYRRTASRPELLRGARLAVDAAIEAMREGVRVEPHLRAAQYFLSRIADQPDTCFQDVRGRSA